MKFSRFSLFAAAVLMTSAVTGLVGCGDDDDNPVNPTDGGGDVVNPTDGGDAGCKFNDYVLNLINTQTNGTSLPTTDLGDNCTDDKTPFPATTFQ